MADAYITVEGNLGGDPEMRYTPNGRPVTQFSVARSYRRKNDQTGEWEDDGTDWFRVSIWGDQAERAAETLKKGERVFVRGRFRSREWESEKTGKSGVALEITADYFKGFGKRSEEEGYEGGGFGQAGPQRGTGTNGSRQPVAAASRSAAPSDDDLDDLPF